MWLPCSRDFKTMKRFWPIFFLFLLVSCGNDTPEQLFLEPAAVAVDSANDRLFVLEKDSRLFILTASDRDHIGDQPVVNKKRLTDIFDALPPSPTAVALFSTGTVSRLFIAGGQTGDSGFVLNRILVLDFDGTTLAASSLSPIDLSDGDDSTADTDNVIGSLLVDQDNGRLYATDSSGGRLHVFDAATGAEAAASVAIAGIPNRMALSEGQIYVANNSDVDAERVITVVDTADLSTAAIDLDIPTEDLAVASGSGGTVLLAKESGTQRVVVETLNTTTFATADISAGDSTVLDGQMLPGVGLTSAVGSLALVPDANGTLFGYVAQADGNLSLLTFASDLSSYTATTLSTVTKVIDGSSLFTGPAEIGNILYLVAPGSGDLLFTDVGSSDIDVRF